MSCTAPSSLLSDRLPRCDSCDHARDRIAQVLEERGLAYDVYVGCKDKKSPMEVHVTVPTQSGVLSETKIIFQNEDELWFQLHGFKFQKYPSHTIAGENFFQGLADYFAGEARIVERVGKASGVPRTARWEVKAKRGWLPISVDILSWRALSLTPFIEYMYTHQVERDPIA